MPRIISGDFKGMRLNSIEGMKTRPTSDKVKGAVFNILTQKVPNTRILDLYAGTGQMGLEALSRGAVFATFVDHGRSSIRCIRENIKKTRTENQSEIIGMDIVNAVKQLKSKPNYNIVYMDPPYDSAILSFRTVAENMASHEILAEDAIVVLEHSAKSIPEEFVINLKLKRSCKYGSIMVSFYAMNHINCSDKE